MAKKAKLGTYRFYAEKLGLHIQTVKKYGKEKCRKLMIEKGLPDDAFAQPPIELQLTPIDWSKITRAEFDEKSRDLGAKILYSALLSLERLKDSAELTPKQRADVNLSILRIIAGAK